MSKWGSVQSSQLRRCLRSKVHDAPIHELCNPSGPAGRCDATAQPDSAATNPVLPELLSQHEREIVREPILDLAEDCNGELVLITGEILHVFNGVEVTPQGDFTHTEDTFHAAGTGAGENGSQYVFSVSGIFVFNTPYPTASQSTFTRKERFLLISKDGGANFVEQVIFHVTVNPDGEPKVTADFQNTECRGLGGAVAGVRGPSFTVF